MTREITTEQLIEACASEGINVSVTQLGRWVREGLILASLRRRHGRGRGMGTEWLWKTECLPQAVLIGRTLANDNRSFQQTAMILTATGYAPAIPRLRLVLLDGLATFRQLMTTRQTYLTQDHSQAEKRKRLNKHMRRKMPDMPDAVFEPFTACIGALFGVISPDDLNAPESMKQFQQFISFPALQQRLETVDSSVLLEKYEEAGHMIPVLAPVIVGMFNWFLLPLLRQQLQKEGRETSTLPISIDPEAILGTIQMEAGHTITSNPGIGYLRLALAIFLTAIPTEDVAVLSQWYTTLQEVIFQLLNYKGISPELMIGLLERGNTSSA
jgi:hypothetical protein